MKLEHERISKLLTDTVILVCRNGLHFNTELKVQGLLAISVDNCTFSVQINHSFCDCDSLPPSSPGCSSESLHQSDRRQIPCSPERTAAVEDRKWSSTHKSPVSDCQSCSPCSQRGVEDEKSPKQSLMNSNWWAGRVDQPSTSSAARLSDIHCNTDAILVDSDYDDNSPMRDQRVGKSNDRKPLTPDRGDLLSGVGSSYLQNSRESYFVKAENQKQADDQCDECLDCGCKAEKQEAGCPCNELFEELQVQQNKRRSPGMDMPVGQQYGASSPHPCSPSKNSKCGSPSESHQFGSSGHLLSPAYKRMKHPASYTARTRMGSSGKSPSYSKVTLTQFVCNECNTAFSHQSSLLSHQIRMHGRVKNDRPGRPGHYSSIPKSPCDTCE